jgi:thioredoxin-related protein
LVDEAGQLGTVSSSERFKKDIKPIDSASEAILALKPVSFEYKSDKTNTPQFGLIAEEVEKVNPALVVHDKQGRPYTVLYDKVNAMLLNEFLKEHRKVEALEAAVTRQHKDFEAVVAELKGQIQKVSAQLEVSKSAPQTVLNISNAATVQQSRQRVRVFRSRCQRHRKRGSLV